MQRIRLRGIQDFIPFLQLLDSRRISYKINRARDDSVFITVTTVGKRIEIDFFQDHIEYSWFEGNEEVLDDQDGLYRELEEFVGD